MRNYSSYFQNFLFFTRINSSIKIIILFFIVSGYSQDIDQFKDISPEVLFENSWKSFSYQEKLIIRTYLKNSYPNRVEGMFSKAYIAGVNGGKEKKIATYKKCLEKYPNHLPTLYNLSNTLSGDEAIDLIEKINKADITFNHYGGLKRKFWLLFDKDNTSTVESYLSEVSVDFPNHYISKYLWAIYYEHIGEYQKSKTDYEEALTLNSEDFDVVTGYINLGLNKLTSSNTPIKERIAYLNVTSNYVEKPNISHLQMAEAILFYADKLLLFNSKKMAFDHYVTSFRLYPTAESVQGAYDVLHLYDQQSVKQFLNEAETTLPNNSVIQSILASRYLIDDFDLEKSKKHYLSSISNSRTFNDSIKNTNNMCAYYYETGELNYNESIERMKLILNSRDNLSNDHKFDIYSNLYRTHLQAFKFDQALLYLKKINQTKKLKKNYFDAKKNELLIYIENENRRKLLAKETVIPQIIPTTTLRPKNTLSVSKDNVFAALGKNPVQLWNIQKQHKIKDLGLGGYEVKFSPNGKYLATISKNTRPGGWVSSGIFIYEVKTGIALHQIPSPSSQDIESFDWSPSSDKLVYNASSGSLFIYDLNSRKRIANRMGSRQISGVLLWHKSNNWIISGQSQAQELVVHNALDLSINRVLKNVSWPHAMGQTYDGKYILCSDNTGLLSTWDTQNDFILINQKKIGLSSKNISPHPSQPIVALNSFTKKNNQYPLVTYDVKKQVIIDSTNSKLSRPKISFSKDGKSIFRAGLNTIDILSSKGLTLEISITGESDYSYSSKRDKENDYYLTVDDEGVKVWNILNGRKVFTWEEKPDLFHKIKAKNDQFLAVFNSKEKESATIYLYNTSNFSDNKILTTDFNLDYIAESKNYFVFAGSQFPDGQGNVKRGEILILEKLTFKSIKRISNIELVEDYLKYEGGKVPRAKFTSIDITNDGKEIVYSTAWQDSFGRPLTYSKKCRQLNVKDGELMLEKTISIESDIKKVQYSDTDDKYIKITSSSYYELYDKLTLSSVEYISKNVGSKTKTLKNGDKIFYNEDNIILKSSKGNKTIRYPSSNLLDLEVFEDKNLFITLTNLNEIEFYDLEEFLKKLTIVSKKNQEYISYTPKGQYVASKNGSNRVIVLSSNEKYIDIKSLPDKTSYDGLIKEQLSAIYSRKKFNLPSSIKDVNIPPNSTFIPAIKDKTILFDNVNYNFSFQILNERYNNDAFQIEVNLNGHKINDENINKSINKDTINYNISIRFRQDENLLQIFQLYNGFKILKIQKKFYSNIVTKEVASLPRLWIFGIGISEYKNGNKTLDYADKDVKDIIETFKKQKGLVYSEIKANSTILDSLATRNNIEMRLDQLEDEVNDDDIVLIYYSGHGEIIREELCLMPWDIDFDKNHPRYRVRDLIEFARRRRSDKAHTILMLDMCNSGKVKKELFNSGAKYKESGGISVFASSIGSESLENRNFGKNGNGAFTSAVISGIKGDADRLGNQNKEVDLDELSVFIAKKVDKLTGEIQTPEMTTTGHAKKIIISKINE